ncbi:hypothetical protein [Ancylobacter terrae]|uniref:hypothetical protein n=1 Tax=Ancylobacter sp. sgz301288 TaxID=3342077 RepID=UPI00385DBD84
MSETMFDHQPELRLLEEMPRIPPGCMTFLVQDEAFEPHLHRGEFAVVDLADHRPAPDEMFLIGYRSPLLATDLAVRLCVARRSRHRPDARPSWWAVHQMPDSRRDVPSCSEGPLSADGLASMLIGRVIGVFVPKIGADREVAHG